jgi:hypothetical protein
LVHRVRKRRWWSHRLLWRRLGRRRGIGVDETTHPFLNGSKTTLDKNGSNVGMQEGFDFLDGGQIGDVVVASIPQDFGLVQPGKGRSVVYQRDCKKRTNSASFALRVVLRVVSGRR